MTRHTNKLVASSLQLFGTLHRIAMQRNPLKAQSCKLQSSSAASSSDFTRTLTPVRCRAHGQRPMRKFVGGFTLIESMVAIAIIALAISGPLWAAGNSLRAAEVAQDQLTASSLAQEAVEYVRAIRDDEYLKGYQTGTDGWAAFLSDVNGCAATPSPGGCEMNLGDWDHPYPSSSGQPLLSCASPSASCNSPLMLKTSGGGPPGPPSGGTQSIYNRSTGTVTSFMRRVTVDNVGINGAQVERVVATVTWSKNGTPYSVTISDDLTSWQ